MTERLPTIRELRTITGLSQARFAEAYGIPKRTIENWEGGSRKAPDYLIRLLARAIKEDFPAKLTWSGFEADLSRDVPVFKPKLCTKTPDSIKGIDRIDFEVEK